MRKKYILLSVPCVLFLILGFLTLSLYFMDIEDRYGDLQQVYFKSTSGDIIINNLTLEEGQILIKDSSIYVVAKTREFQLDAWLDIYQKNECNLDIYSSDYKVNRKSKLHLEIKF